MVLDYLKKELFTSGQEPEFKLHEGSVFTAVECADGHIGICAAMDQGDGNLADNYKKYIIDQALINSMANRPELKYDDASFIDIIPLNEKNNIIMLGFIEPIYMQMNKKGIGCKVFDFRKKSPILSPLNEYDKSIEEGRTFIITATSLSNGSFDQLIQKAHKDADIYMIGPSAPMSRKIFDYAPQLKAVFGSIVKSKEAIGAIMDGAGTRTLSPFLRKASVIR